MVKKILINNIFVGGYGNDESNIPHEVINLFRSDTKIIYGEYGKKTINQGKFYVYITPTGVLKNPDELKGIIFVRSVGNKLVEVLAKAEGKMKYIPTINNASKNKKYHNDILKEIFYGGHNITEFYNENSEDYGVYVTFEVEKLCMRKKTFYLTNNPNTKDTDPRKDSIILVSDQKNQVGKKINNQSERTYFDESQESYNILNNLLEDDNYWEDCSNTPNYTKESTVFNDDNIFKISLQQDNEVVFTNMLYYYLSSNKQLCKDFITKVLGLTINTDDIIVHREKEKMDISIECSDDLFIIIENKINSGINGIKYDDNLNLIKKEGKVVSQLSNYYLKALEKMKDENKVKAFIIHPTYVNFNLNDYLDGDKYTAIKYSELYTFFKNIDYIDDGYLPHFVKALFKHSRETNDEFVRAMYKKLNNRIRKIEDL